MRGGKAQEDWKKRAEGRVLVSPNTSEPRGGKVKSVEVRSSKEGRLGQLCSQLLLSRGG